MSALTRAEILRARQAGFIPERQGRAGQVVSAILRRRRPEPVAWPPRKEQARCCVALTDEHGRLPLGFCSPECIRRPGNDPDRFRLLGEAGAWHERPGPLPPPPANPFEGDREQARAMGFCPECGDDSRGHTYAVNCWWMRRWRYKDAAW